jgi:hypothetical protein
MFWLASDGDAMVGTPIDLDECAAWFVRDGRLVVLHPESNGWREEWFEYSTHWLTFGLTLVQMDNKRIELKNTQILGATRRQLVEWLRQDEAAGTKE